METALAWLGASAFFLVISSSLYELVSGRALRVGSTWGSRRALWSQRQVRFAAVGTLLMGVGGMVQVWAHVVSVETAAGFRLFVLGAVVFIIGAGVAVPVYVRSRTRS